MILGKVQLKQNPVRIPYCMIPEKSDNDQCMQTSLDIQYPEQPDWKRMRERVRTRVSAARLLRGRASASWTRMRCLGGQLGWLELLACK